MFQKLPNKEGGLMFLYKANPKVRYDSNESHNIVWHSSGYPSGFYLGCAIFSFFEGFNTDDLALYHLASLVRTKTVPEHIITDIQFKGMPDTYKQFPQAVYMFENEALYLESLTMHYRQKLEQLYDVISLFKLRRDKYYV